ncbi:MAG TPA: HNH endonuclease signature motif containing protein [Pyrinomonadaceae bacterium]|nr:HNH endonuclease signature motif containing protein [Pyrinomonadaceae bacterium]
MSDIPARLRRWVVLRAGNRCEYCRLAQQGQEATFHVDHILPRAAGGRTGAANLALACVSCSLRKEARRSAIEPKSNRRVALFHPRRQRWRDHFRWEGLRIVGLTPTGRASVAALQMNRPLILAIRQEDALRGRLLRQ